MQEKSVTSAGRHFKLDSAFFVLATQNPIEQEGTTVARSTTRPVYVLTLLDYLRSTMS
jgi:hypothetical protein